jgi:hypothetical protein
MFLLVTVEAQCQTIQDPEILLQRIRDRMTAHLSQLPNYTCHEAVDRLMRRANSGTFERLDRLELEVALVGNKELFARAGEGHFEEQEIHKMVPGGTIGNGAFGSYVETVLSGDGTALQNGRTQNVPLRFRSPSGEEYLSGEARLRRGDRGL